MVGFLFYKLFIIMKIIISERQQRLIKENSMREELINQIKDEGFKSTSEMVGGYKNLIKVLKINSPMDFLHLFDYMEVVQREKNYSLILYRYRPRQNLMIYDRKNDNVSINYNEIWSVLEDHFGLKYSEIRKLTEKWLDEAYNLKGVTTQLMFLRQMETLDEAYNLKGVTTNKFDVFSTDL